MIVFCHLPTYAGLYVGGAIGSVQLSGKSAMSYNNATEEGGALYAGGGISGSLSLKGGSQLIGNEAKRGGGAVYSGNGIAEIDLAGGSVIAYNRVTEA